MDTVKILAPRDSEKVYAIAAQEFQKFYREVTGRTLPIVYEPGADGDLVVIGSDAVNDFASQLIFEGLAEDYGIRYGTDDYALRSLSWKGRRVLVLAGGRGRSTLYSVYDFFQRRGDCRYFWDGDRVPRGETLDITGLDVREHPRFELRGLRYFAHRSLHRFQAEHWSYEDWCREIDWIAKKRLNFFMLRIGQDDLYQRAFPELVDYPPAEGVLPEAEGGYDDRTLFWPLQYRGELRKKILQYAFDRDLVHPEDCGTMTHWYSRTPKQFLEKVQPDFMPQTTGGYRQPTGLVWDIRQKQNLDNYFKLTDTSVREYGRPELFHTIGLAERRCSDDRRVNLELKLYTYRRIARHLQQNYPNARLLIASWDFIMYWEPEEVQKLVAELDPSRAVILDYTSESEDEINFFANWGIQGHFPWTFGIFHGYEPNSDIRGDYRQIVKRLSLAAGDESCQGMIFWPELSHSDTFMLDYFTANAWRPLEKTPEEQLKDFCAGRYGPDEKGMEMTSLWEGFFPLIGLSCWQFGRNQPKYRRFREYFFDIFYSPTVFTRCYSREDSYNEPIRYYLEQARPHLERAGQTLHRLAALSDEARQDVFIFRDAMDIARTTAGRILNLGIYRLDDLFLRWREGEKLGGEIQRLCGDCERLLELLGELLGQHPDYSLNATMERMRGVHPVNPAFELALKHNADNGYCRSYIFELVKYLCLPEVSFLFGEICKAVEGAPEDYRSDDSSCEANRTWFMTAFEQKPLCEMKPQTHVWQPLLEDIADVVGNICKQL